MNNVFNLKLPNGKTLQQVGEELAKKIQQEAQTIAQNKVSTCKTCGKR